MPTSAWSLIEAAVVERRMAGAADAAPLFVGPNGRAVSVRGLRRLLMGTAWQLGLRMPGEGAPGAVGQKWFQRTGTQVVRLPSLRLAIDGVCRAR